METISANNKGNINFNHNYINQKNIAEIVNIKDKSFENEGISNFNTIFDDFDKNLDNNYGFFSALNYNEYDENNECNETIIDLYPNSFVDNEEENIDKNNITINKKFQTVLNYKKNEEVEDEKNNLNNNEENLQNKKRKRKKKKKKESNNKVIISAKNTVRNFLVEKRLNYVPPKVIVKTLKQEISAVNIANVCSKKINLERSHSTNNIIRSASTSNIIPPSSPPRIKKHPKLKPIVNAMEQRLKEKENYEEHLTKIRKQFAEKKYLVPELKNYQYVIVPGNASYLIKRSFQHRTNWKESESQITSIYNFKWQQSHFGVEFQNLSKIESLPQIVNHFEFNIGIANKANLFANLFGYCELNHLNVFQYVPFTILLNQTNYNEIKFKELFTNIENFIADYSQIPNIRLKKIKNKTYNNTAYNSFFSIPNNIYVPSISRPKTDFDMGIGSRTNLVIPHSHYNGKNLWLIKASNLNRGQCIRIVDSLEKAHEIIKTFQNGITLQGTNKDKTENNFQINSLNASSQNIPPNNHYKTDKIIIQKYIERPLLYKGRKCDMRIWVLLSHEMKVYVFKEGHLKTCSENFDLNNKNDAYVHLTNYSYQKHCLNFQKFEVGNEVSFHDFQKELNLTFPEKEINVYKDIMPKVKEIINLTMNSVKHSIDPNNRQFCFEIFGYDFMLDDELNMFLIEINANPGIEESSPWIKVIVPRMLDDALRLTVDKVFNTKYDFKEVKILLREECSNEIPKKNKDLKDLLEEKNNFTIENKDEKNKDTKKKTYTYNSPFPVPGYEQDENLWELVCNLKEDKKSETFTGVKHLLNKKKLTTN